MALSRDELVDILNDLLETCYDGLDGFRTAASTVERPDAIVLFQSRAQRIDEAAAELYTAIRRLGGHPAEHGHPEARVHRGWIHLRHAVASEGDNAVLAEVERGEDESIRRYRHAIAQNLPRIYTTSWPTNWPELKRVSIAYDSYGISASARASAVA